MYKITQRDCTATFGAELLHPQSQTGDVHNVTQKSKRVQTSPTCRGPRHERSNQSSKGRAESHLRRAYLQQRHSRPICFGLQASMFTNRRITHMMRSAAAINADVAQLTGRTKQPRSVKLSRLVLRRKPSHKKRTPSTPTGTATISCVSVERRLGVVAN